MYVYSPVQNVQLFVTRSAKQASLKDTKAPRSQPDHLLSDLQWEEEFDLIAGKEE